MLKKTKLAVLGGAALAVSLASSLASAATSVSWVSPPDGSAYPVGTSVSPTGQASGVGTTGSGLDLVLVLDSSGSMTTSETVNGVTKSRREWQADAAKALVNSLPTATTSVGIVEFDSDANLVQALLGLEPASNITTLENAIDSVDASGLTNIGSGIDTALAELTGANHTAGRAQMMVVFSDGQSSGAPGENADSAIAGGIDAIHSVGLPGHSVADMQAIVDGVDDTFGTGDDHGVYTDGTDLSALLAAFGGGGNIVGLDHVDVTLPDGTVINDIPTDALGNFTVPGYSLASGANVFVATAFGDDGSSATANLTLFGRDDGGPAQVPEPGSLALMGLGFAGLLGFHARRKRA